MIPVGNTSSIERSSKKNDASAKIIANQKKVSRTETHLTRWAKTMTAKHIHIALTCSTTSQLNQPSIVAATSLSGRSELPWAATKTLNTNSIRTIIDAPMSIPLLLPTPPMMKAAHTRKVVFAGDMKEGWKPDSFHAQSAPAKAAIEAPSARLAALCRNTS